MSTVGAAGAGHIAHPVSISKVHAVVLDFLERASWTAGQQFFAVLLTTSAAATIVDLPWELASVMAIGAAVVSVIATAVQYLSRMTELGYWPDLLVRLAKTFLASLLASFGATAINVFDFDWASALNLAAMTTITALAKGMLARGSVAEGTPSTLPAAVYEESVARN